MFLVVREPEANRPGGPVTTIRIQQFEHLTHNLSTRWRSVARLEEAADVTGKDSLLGGSRHRPSFVSVRHRFESPPQNCGPTFVEI
jgi:hypothetical protein